MKQLMWQGHGTADKLKIWIYNPNSSGGNYEYAKQLEKAYNQSGIFDCILIFPKNAEFLNKSSNILISDDPHSQNILIRKIHFIRRTLINPIRFYLYLIKTKSNGIILFNDFDQLSTPFWSSLFRRIKKRYIFGSMLHDPDRTNYPPHPAYSAFCMRKMLGLLDFVFYHDHLPDLSYYHDYEGLKVSVPHGLYPLAVPDKTFQKRLLEWKNNSYTLGIIGNIRKEKNYDLAIKALAQLPDVKMVIAGKPSNSSVSIKEYKRLAEQLNVSDRIFWYADYMADHQLSALINIVDLPLLYYQRSFTSQSGIVNLLASAKKNVLISDTDSGLSKLAKKFGFGLLIDPDNLSKLIEGIIMARNKMGFANEWGMYLDYADWNQHPEIMKGITEKLNNHEALVR